MRWIKKMIDTFLWSRRALNTMQSLGKVIQRVPAVGAKMWCLFFTSRMPRSGKLPVLNLLTGKNIRFFAPHGRFVALIHVKLGRADEHMGLLGSAKFHLNWRRWMGMRPQNLKNFHFW